MPFAEAFIDVAKSFEHQSYKSGCFFIFYFPTCIESLRVLFLMLSSVLFCFQWMRHYSLSKLKLDLNSIVGSAECSHAKGKVSSLGQSVTARCINHHADSWKDSQEDSQSEKYVVREASNAENKIDIRREIHLESQKDRHVVIKE